MHKAYPIHSKLISLQIVQDSRKLDLEENYVCERAEKKSHELSMHQWTMSVFADKFLRNHLYHIHAVIWTKKVLGEKLAYKALRSTW